MSDALNSVLHAINFLEEKSCRPYMVLKDIGNIQTKPPFNLKPFSTKENELILNVSQTALGSAGISVIDHETICFQLRFNGTPVTLTIDVDSIVGIYTPDSDEVNELLNKAQAESQIFNNYQKLDFIETIVRHYGEDTDKDILVTVHIDGKVGPDTVYPIYDAGTDSVEIIDEEDDIAKTLTIDKSTGMVNPGGFSIGVVIVEDTAKRRVLALTDSRLSYVFDNALGAALASMNEQRLKEAAKREAEVLDFPGQQKETNQTPETEHPVLNLGNVVDMNLFRNKNR